MIKCIKVEPLDGHKIRCTLSDSRVVEFLVDDIDKFDTPIVTPLKNDDFFRSVFLEFGAPTWPNGYDICPDFLALHGTEVGNAGISKAGA